MILPVDVLVSCLPRRGVVLHHHRRHSATIAPLAIVNSARQVPADSTERNWRGRQPRAIKISPTNRMFVDFMSFRYLLLKIFQKICD